MKQKCLGKGENEVGDDCKKENHAPPKDTEPRETNKNKSGKRGRKNTGSQTTRRTRTGLESGGEEELRPKKEMVAMQPNGGKGISVLEHEELQEGLKELNRTLRPERVKPGLLLCPSQCSPGEETDG